MKDDHIKVTIIGVEDKDSFNELMAKVQVDVAMKMCPPKLRMQVLDTALKILKSSDE